MQDPGALPALRHPAEGRPEDAALADFPLEEQILVALAHQPWASASDLAKRLDTSASETHKECQELKKNQLIARREMGVTRRIQRRYVLARRGVMHVTRPFQYKGLLRAALPLTWQMTEKGVEKMLEWLPMIESLYKILPTFWTSELARPFQWQSRHPDPSCSSLVWLGEPTLTEVRWLPSGRLHAVATWRFERHFKRPKSYSIPFFWAGLLPQEDYRSRSLRLGSKFIRSPHSPQDRIWWDIEPPVAAIGMDEFAAFRSKTAYGDDVRVGAADTAGALVWSAEASHSEWTLREKPPRARSIGDPEAVALEEGPDLVNLGGTRDYRLLGFVSEFRAASEANLVRAYHMSRGAVSAVVGRLQEHGLIAIVEYVERNKVVQNIYITQRGRKLFASRDRVDDDRLAKVTHLDPEGADAVRERRHDSAVAGVAAAFQGAGMAVAAGWRWVVSWHGGQLVPDLWVQVPVPGREEGIWLPVEVEFSAKTVKRIEEKLRSYRLAPIRLGQTFPILVITGDELPAKLFDDLAGDLTILTTTLKAFLTGVWEEPESVWRRKGLPVGLSDIARARRAHLMQPTGRSLDYGKPTLEVWEGLLGQEIIWSDPQTEDLDWGSPPIHPDLQEMLDHARNEIRAGSAQNQLISDPTPPTPPEPPTPSPQPVRKAADAPNRVPHAAPAVPPASRPFAAPELDRWEALRRINYLVADADRIAESRLKETDLTAAERLCLQRVRAIITYGAAQQYTVDESVVERMVQQCLQLEDQRQHERRSGNAILRWLATPSTQTDPRRAFMDLLKEFPNIRQDACKLFNDWFSMVDRALRTARRSRTPE